MYRRTLALNLILTALATASALLGPQFLQAGIDHYLTRITDPATARHGIFLISAAYDQLLPFTESTGKARANIRIEIWGGSAADAAKFAKAVQGLPAPRDLARLIRLSLNSCSSGHWFQEL